MNLDGRISKVVADAAVADLQVDNIQEVRDNCTVLLMREGVVGHVDRVAGLRNLLDSPHVASWILPLVRMCPTMVAKKHLRI